MHTNVSTIVGSAILRVKDALERLTSVATQTVRLPARIDISHQKHLLLPKNYKKSKVNSTYTVNVHIIDGALKLLRTIHSNKQKQKDEYE